MTTPNSTAYASLRLYCWNQSVHSMQPSSFSLSKLPDPVSSAAQWTLVNCSHLLILLLCPSSFPSPLPSFKRPSALRRLSCRVLSWMHHHALTMQCLQSGLAYLPDELWAQVLCKLPQEDLLTARLVSKNFVRLHQIPKLNLEWCMSSPSTASSLALFVARHLRQPCSPTLEITISSSDKGLVQTGIILACDCAHLQQLDCKGELTLLQAQSSLRVLPTSLVRLLMFTPPAMMDDTAWNRLTSLTSLELVFPLECPSGLASGTGLSLLTQLESLDLGVDDAKHTTRHLLDAATFRHGSITSLELSADILQGGLDLQHFPKLEAIYFNGLLPVPAWMEGQHVKSLELWQTSQLASVDISKLLCKQLRGHPEIYDPAWKLSDLLLLPNLETFELCRLGQDPPDKHSPALLHGSSQEHRSLLDKIQVQLHVPARLCRADDQSADGVDLAKNGHAAVCRCKECPP